MSNDIVDRALTLIKPNAALADSCATTIRSRIDLLRQAHINLSTIPSPGKLKNDLKKIRDDLNRTRRNLQSTIACAVVFEKDGERQKAFFDELDRLIDSAEFYRNALVIPPGSRRWDNLKALAARFAAELLKRYSVNAPTKTPNGVYFSLASMIYEGVTGKDNVDLSQYCRDHLDSADQPGGGRIEPGIVVRMPFAKR